MTAMCLSFEHDCSSHNWEPNRFFTTQWSINQIQRAVAPRTDKSRMIAWCSSETTGPGRTKRIQPPDRSPIWPSCDAHGMKCPWARRSVPLGQVCQALVGVLEKGLGTVSSRGVGAVRSDGHGHGCDGIRLIYRNRQCIISACIYILHTTVPFTLSRRRIAISIAFLIDVHCHTLFDMFIHMHSYIHPYAPMPYWFDNWLHIFANRRDTNA